MTNLYDEYKRIFNKKEFQLKIEKLKKKLKNKRVILYSNGIYFSAFSDFYNLNDYFNVIGVSDIRYETEDIEKFKGFNCIKPSEIKKHQIDAIIITSPNFDTIKKYLIENNLIDKKTLIVDTIYKPSFKEKVSLITKYLEESKDIIKTIKYSLFCTNEELETKINYRQVLKRIKKQDKIRVLFVCEENSKWGYQSVYEEMIKSLNI